MSSAEGNEDQSGEGEARDDGAVGPEGEPGKENTSSEEVQGIIDKIKDERQRLEDEWMAEKLQNAYDSNPNVAKKVDIQMASRAFEERQEALLKEGESIKKDFERDAKRVIKELDEEFERAVSVMNMRITNIIKKGRTNITRSLETSDGVPFPPDAAGRLAAMEEDDDDEAFYDELGVLLPPSLEEGRQKVFSPEERDKMDADVISLPPSDVVKEAAARVAAIAERNATASASVVRRKAQSAGHVVVVGGSDGDLGTRVMDLFAADVALGDKGAAGVTAVEGISLAEARAVAAGSGAGQAGGTGRISAVKAALERVKTLVVLPSDPGPKASGGGGGGLSGFFGGGGDSQGGAQALSDEDAAGLVEICGKGLKNVVCLSVGVSSGGGVGAALFGTGGEDSKGFPTQSNAEQGVLRKAKAKGLSYMAVRASQFTKSPRARASPLVTPKNVPRPGKIPDASRAVVAEAILRASYQPESRRNSTFAISDFPESPASWPVPSCGWADELVKLSGPELYRVSIPAELPSGASGTLKAWGFLREWGKLWKKEGSGLTTRVQLFTDDEARRVGLYFDPTTAPYVSPEEEKKAEERRRELDKKKGASGPSRPKSKGSPEGGVEVVVEEQPYARVRVMRGNMGPDTVVKEMSEATILEKLKKDVQQYIISPKGKK